MHATESRNSPMSLVKSLASHLPNTVQHELKKLQYGVQIRYDRFYTQEPEFAVVADIIRPGDWILDIGANVGHYTKRFSELTGPTGRVIAFEPVPTTFALLASNARLFTHSNVTLFNAAVSDRFGPVGMAIPQFDSGLTNYYEAHLSAPTESDLSVLAMNIDSLGLEARIALAKIDAEGHEAAVLKGMRATLQRDMPVLIVETSSPEVIASLESLGYRHERLPESPNILFRPAR